MLDKENLRLPGNPAKQSPTFMESSRTLMERIRVLQHQEYSLQASITKTTGPNYRKLLEEKDEEIEELKNKLEHYKEAYEALKAKNDKRNSNGDTYSQFPSNQSIKHRMAKTIKQLTREKKREAFQYFALCSFYVALILLTVHVIPLGILFALRQLK
ncbi:hypothetical protein GCK72_015461 [Caenorhabditis remanei]|uniref:Uncharacterized protein n=1 Tax=Caenorhabditis remanei TaxID=31234 RepID=A0A6A5GWK2_CAERE|nr:hypothetical protein GCK72_015461 [Caenorhabditis remanei]KAF1759001.1 hypothetical protein GCK72_015461 [Caenorhabditis remanei]